MARLVQLGQRRHAPSKSVAPISGSSSSMRCRRMPASHARVHAATACCTVSWGPRGITSGWGSLPADAADADAAAATLQHAWRCCAAVLLRLDASRAAAGWQLSALPLQTAKGCILGVVVIIAVGLCGRSSCGPRRTEVWWWWQPSRESLGRWRRYSDSAHDHNRCGGS